MPKKRVFQSLEATLVDVQINGPRSGRGSTKSSVALQVRVDDHGEPRYEWLAVVNTPVRTRIRELMAAPDFVMGHRFALLLNEAGQVEGLQRVEGEHAT